MTALKMNLHTALFSAGSTTTAGETAHRIIDLERRAATHLRVVASARPSGAINDLYALAAEEGVSLDRSPVFQMAKQFLLALPIDVTSPELAIDSDGEVVFDWVGRAGELFTASLRADGRLSYAARFSALNKDHGTKVFSGELPPRVAQLIREVTAAGSRASH